MASPSPTTERLDYLQRRRVNVDELSLPGEATTAPAALRRLMRVRSIGIRDRLANVPRPERLRLPTQDVLVGLYGYKIPVAFLVGSEGYEVDISFGVWSPVGREDAPEYVMSERLEILKASLRSAHPGIEFEETPSELRDGDSLSGFAVGIPTAKSAETHLGLPMDRLLRALRLGKWAALVLAEPVDESLVAQTRAGVLNEMRAIEAEAQAQAAPSPLAKYYLDHLQALLESLTVGTAEGAWRTAVYLLGDEISYYRLASVWRGIFSGPASVPEPVRVWDAPGASQLASAWALPDTEGAPGPGSYAHPFSFQTLLTSEGLSAYVHLPTEETQGFRVTLLPRFDVVPPPGDSDGFVLGTVLADGDPTKTPYVIQARQLTRHTLVGGVTGSGKTNTIFYLLEQAATRGLPFLVIEPAKREYRALLDHPELKNRLQVFTLGDETVSPFRLNPFEVIDGIPVNVHLDLLRSAFAASFGMWTPLPQILERCLQRIYVDRGWDLASNRNVRLGKADSNLAFPTLSDLVRKVDEVTAELGYEDRITSDIRAALHTRLDSLRIGGKGAMLDVERSLPIDGLVAKPTVLELEGLGDDDDKAFLMGLLFIRLAEHRRSRGPRQGLEHLLVIEEAHRLLARTGEKREEEADVRGKAVETFSNLLSEIRAYGQGVAIIDQVPVRLDPGVIKNTILKIGHRTVHEEDRDALGGSMAMNEHQREALAVLQVGQAVVFSEGDDAPIMIQVERAKDLLSATLPDDRRVAEEMLDQRRRAGIDVLLAPTRFCKESCVTAPAVCREARGIAEDPGFDRTFARFVLSAVEDVGAVDRLWPDLMGSVRARRDPLTDEQTLLSCLAAHASARMIEHRGAQSGWSYADTQALAERLAAMILAEVAGTGDEKPKIAFLELARRLHARTYAPFSLCDRICTQQPPVCLYRHAASDLLVDPGLTSAWQEADQTDGPKPGRRPESWVAAMDAAYQLIEFPYEDWTEADKERGSGAARRAALCFAQQQLARDVSKTPRTVRRIVEELIDTSGHDEA